MPPKRSLVLFFLFLNSLFNSHIRQDAEEESGEDFADDIDNLPADDDELSEAENKKRKVRLIIPVITTQRLLNADWRSAPCVKDLYQTRVEESSKTSIRSC